MLGTLAVVVFLSSIVVFFMKEIGDFVKKMRKISSVAFLTPLFIASVLVEWYLNVFDAIFTWLDHFMSWVVSTLQGLLPFQAGTAPIIEILFIFLLTMLPIGIAFAIKQTKLVIYDYTSIAYRVSAVIWLIMAILLTNLAD